MLSLQDVSALRNRTMVGTETLLGSSPRRQRGRGTLDRGTKHLGRGRNAEKQRGKAGMKICMYKTIKKNQSKSISIFLFLLSPIQLHTQPASIQHKLTSGWDLMLSSQASCLGEEEGYRR